MGQSSSEFSAIQYVGEYGITEECKRAVERFIVFGDKISSARIVTCGNEHCLLLTIDDLTPVMVKSGFASGYSGEGPRGFSYILQLLNAKEVRIDECEVSRKLFCRINACALSSIDLATIQEARPILPHRWSGYAWDVHEILSGNRHLWGELPDVMPLSIIDPRIIDLALSFWRSPDEKLATAYRRLEDTVRGRSKLENYDGVNLFRKAFLGDGSVLHWPGAKGGEAAGRVDLFTGAFQAFRNRRMHREPKAAAKSELAEFLLVNQLFRLEREAVHRPNDDQAPGVNLDHDASPDEGVRA